jgi:hypothetical protein
MPVLSLDIHYTTPSPTWENQFILDGTIYVDEVPTNGITVTATLNGNSKSDVTGSTGEAGYYKIVFPPTPGPVTLSYTFNGETQTVNIPYDDVSVGGAGQTSTWVQLLPKSQMRVTPLPAGYFSTAYRSTVPAFPRITGAVPAT